MDVYGIVGNPVEHSKSPPIHNAAFGAVGLDATYVTFESEADAAETVIRGAEALGVSGMSVTLPLKEEVMPSVTLAESAANVGAVNTIDFTDDGPVGYNTDGTGVVRAFEHHDVDLSGVATVVGAGGAGKAAAFALAGAGMDVRIANRTVERAHTLADKVPGGTGHGLDELPELLPETDVLTNMTNVGMEEDVTPVPADLLHADLAVLDAIYEPRQTRLLRDTAEAGATTIDGTWMLLYQGVEAFEIWTGVDAPISAMDEGLRSQL
jgi:shikimate dehydrogenase